jgi:predicted DNA-binding protein (UPF0251 family)
MEKKWWQQRHSSKEKTTEGKNVKFEDLESMRVEELHAMQEDLAHKLEMTNSLLQSKLSSTR